MSESPATRPAVLVVDDAPENIKVLGEALRGDYDVRFAMSGAEALRMVNEESRPELILLDIEMPGLDGYEVCKRLKSEPRTEDIPIIFITAKENEADETRGLELGAVDYIKKPFSIPVVKARVKRHIGKSPDGTQAVANRIGGYDIVKRLSRGGMGDVFLATKRGKHGFAKQVAIKLVHPHLADRESYRELFFHEARIAAQLSHPCLCHVFDFGEDDGHYYLVMEYVPGLSLSGLVKKIRAAKARMPPAIACYLIAEAARGLEHAHTAVSQAGQPMNIVHRDVSPQNLMVSFQGEIKILDFGIARSEERESLTEAGTIRGKPAYMAPEQAKCLPIDRRADIFSLGVIMHELITGVPLFSRENEYATYTALLSEPIPFVRTIAPEVSAVVARIVHRALSRVPGDRFQTAAEMAQSLDDASGAERATRDTLIAYLRELVDKKVVPPDDEEAMIQTKVKTAPTSLLPSHPERSAEAARDAAGRDLAAPGRRRRNDDD